ncbi:hypothetical protein PENSPDRAFT_625626 [Peniophora sp. CONT]|nr:hypothetical protein PENSPDRAFT_625626 [Peniophora sp. CONT]
MTTPSAPIPNSNTASSSPTISTSSVFNFEDADVTLRSSNGVDFHVHRWPLSKASPFFAALFSLPQAYSTTVGQRITCDMSEDSQTTELLLAFCYPRSLCEEPLLDDITDVERALTLAKKFDLNFVIRPAERALERIAATTPDLVYAMAWRYELSRIVRLAALASLEHPFLPHATTSSFAGVPAEALVQLWGYRMTRVAEAIKPLKDVGLPITWIRQTDIVIGPRLSPEGNTCSCAHVTLSFKDKPEGVSIKGWWWAFVCELVDQLDTFPRDTITLNTRGVLRRAMSIAGDCCVCRDSMAVDALNLTANLLQKEAYRRIKEIPYETPF